MRRYETAKTNRLDANGEGSKGLEGSQEPAGHGQSARAARSASGGFDEAQRPRRGRAAHTSREEESAKEDSQDSPQAAAGEEGGRKEDSRRGAKPAPNCCGETETRGQDGAAQDHRAEGHPCSTTEGGGCAGCRTGGSCDKGKRPDAEAVAHPADPA